jgi:yeast amino acid transporter
MAWRLSVNSIKIAAAGHDPRIPRGQNLELYDRDAVNFPYRSHWQYLRAWYGMVACGLMAIFNGWGSISPFSGGDFVASYISVSDGPHPARF